MVKHPLHRALASLRLAATDARGDGTRATARTRRSGTHHGFTRPAGIGVLTHSPSWIRGAFYYDLVVKTHSPLSNYLRVVLCSTSPVFFVLLVLRPDAVVCIKNGRHLTLDSASPPSHVCISQMIEGCNNIGRNGVTGMTPVSCCIPMGFLEFSHPLSPSHLRCAAKNTSPAPLPATELTSELHTTSRWPAMFQLFTLGHNTRL